MSLRPVAAVIGTFLGAATLVLTATPALASPTQTAPPDALPAQTADAPVPVAHRGASAYAPENTLAAADKAHELGIQWVENDVQRTKDGELVVVHDTTLDRTTDAAEVFPDRSPWKVSDFTAEEIAQLDAGSWFGADFAGEKVPTFTEFLETMTANEQSLLLELKAPELYPGIEKEILAELEKQGWLDEQHVRDRLVIQSFGAESVRTVHTLRPEVTTGFLGTPAVADLAEYARFADQINPRHTDLSADYVKAIHAVEGAHGRPLEVFAWTVDDEATAVKVANMGVDGIISNAPDVVRDATGG